MRRVRGACAALGLSALTLSGCATSVTGHPAGVVKITTTESAATSDSEPAPVKANQDEALHSLLEPPPAGSTKFSDAWGSNEYPSVQDYANAIWQPDARESARDDLAVQGFVDMVHRGWIATDADQIDVLLERFKDDSGSDGRFLSRLSAHRNDRRVALSLPGWDSDHAAALQFAEKTNGQFVEVLVLAWYKDVALEAYYLSPGTLRTADLHDWVVKQLALMRKR
jgi:hypothetical protein